MALRSRWLVAVVGIAMVAGCGGGGSRNSQTQNNVDALRNAAGQSTPAAAEVLRNEASNLSGQNVALPPSDPNSPAQQAMDKAGQVAANQTAAPRAGQEDATPRPAR